MNTETKFSVVICTYNDARYLPKAIESVIDQQFSDWELIIVNDGSADETLEMLRPYKNHPNIHIISLTENKGKAFCLNIALGTAKGTWLIELDADDWLPKGALENIDEIVEIGVEAYYGNYVEWREQFRDKKLSFSKVIKGMSNFQAITYLENAYPLAPRIYRIDTLRKIGGWHTKDIYQSRLYEDVYILCAISKHGKVAHVDRLLYHRRLRKGSVTEGQKGMFEKWREWVRKELSI
ncbi:glycosyltransferase family 2 protein [Bacillus sp. m3-13]|uniref:glycosyltransferase family 2 protein n=1 Tax=Bacillus sp. m3-13 TaxID=406124 RepID=UPI0012F6C6BB|nr:glycosyltransferase family 2 protein [Bacillus sp. m3-13]